MVARKDELVVLACVDAMAAMGIVELLLALPIQSHEADSTQRTFGTSEVGTCGI